MKVSREQMKANRERILTEAGYLFREKGFDAVSVAEIMKAAGLTHGGFYGHFSSKDDLIAQTVTHMLKPGDGAKAADISSLIGDYLSPRHRKGVARGCPTAALVTDICRHGPEARSALTAGVQSQISRISAAMGDAPDQEARRNATGVWATMVGAVILARTIDDETLSNQILEDVREWLSNSLEKRQGLLGH